MNPVILNNTVLRDGHQSMAATRMTTDQMLPAAPVLDGLGFGVLETWGGATIDSCLRFLKENPFTRLDRLKAAAPKTPQMMLLRGQNLVQYTSFPDDIVEAFVKCTAAHGLDLFRVFDALNDARNLQTPIRAVKAAGRHAQGVICYTTSPVHTAERLGAFADELAALGVDSICVKDMAGLLTPRVAYDLVRAIKQRHRLPVVVHSHDTAGFALATYLAVIDAGADAVETSIAPFANGTAQPDTARLLAALSGHERRPHFDLEKLQSVSEHFEGVAKELAAFMSPANERVDRDVLVYQVPGGMLSNFRNQIKELKMEARFAEVMAEIPVVRRALGWIPLVTPTSQIVGTQAMLNVKFGRWANLAQNTIDIALGRYGRTPGPVDPELLALAVKKSGHEPVTVRPADLLAPLLPAMREALAAKGLPVTDDAAVLYAMFPRETEAFFKPPAPPPAPNPVQVQNPVPPAASAPAPVSAGAGSTPMKKLRITVGGQVFDVTVELADETAPAIPRPAAAASPAPLAAPPRAAVPTAAAPVAAGAVCSPLAGKIVSVDVTVGAAVAVGAQLLTVEAMKMNTFVYADRAGSVTAIHTKPGDAVEEGAVLLTLG